MKKWLSLTFLLTWSWVLIHLIVIVSDGLIDEEQKSDVGVILGNKVNPDGSLSERLQKRLDKGLELYRDSMIPLIVVSGGLGKEGQYEGTKMADYLIENGVPTDKIVIDNLGNTTEATASNFKKMNLNIQSITVISQYHHITRCKLAFRKRGFTQVYGVHAEYFEIRDLYSLVREFFGYYSYLLS